jgi:hypothetical protein
MSGKRSKFIRNVVGKFLLTNHISTLKNRNKFIKAAKKQWLIYKSIDLTTVKVEK